MKACFLVNEFPSAESEKKRREFESSKSKERKMKTSVKKSCLPPSAGQGEKGQNASHVP